MAVETTGSLTDSLRESTKALHTQAERSGIVNDILRGSASRRDYALFLRNLLLAYQALEEGLDRHRALPALAPLAQPAVYRAAAIEADLATLEGSAWASMPVLDAGRAYAARIAEAAAQDAPRLVAHAYVRYLGDLNGGQIMKRLLGKALGLEATALGFYDFPGIADLVAFRTTYRDAVDEAGRLIGDDAALRDEAALAFRLNIALSEAIRPVVSA